MIEKVAIPEGLHLLSKPVGSKCNLKCDYCFYLEKKDILNSCENNEMDEEILEAYVKNYIASQSTPEVEFVWHGGEPTIKKIDFYRRAVKLQKKYSSNKKIINSLQTNGTFLNDEWCIFLKENDFIVGLSLDGPENIHNIYRDGSFQDVYRGLKLLNKHNVKFNVLACVGKETANYPLEIYNFFKENNVKYIQFTPIIERKPYTEEREKGQRLGGPAILETSKTFEVTDWTVDPSKYGDFLISIFDQWVKSDVGDIFITNFESALTQWIGNTSPNCIHSRQCGKALALEHDGSIYSCDHYVYPEYYLGNIKKDSLSDLARLSSQKKFGRDKEEKLTTQCKECPALNLCWGGCPKHRFTRDENGEFGHHYLCEGYKMFFMYIPKYLNAMTKLLVNGYPASYIMDAIKGPLVLKKK